MAAWCQPGLAWDKDQRISRTRFAVVVRYAFLARRVDQTAAVLAVPEVAWTAFATVLSTAIAAKNG